MQAQQGSGLSLEMEQWLSHALLVGHSDEDILAGLGDSPWLADARRFLESSRRSPLLQVGQGFAQQLSQVRWLLELQKTVQKDAYAGGVPRIHAREHERFVNDFVSANRPVIVEGLTEGWPANETWNQAALTERLGHHPVEYNHYLVRDNAFVSEKRESTFGEFLRLVYDESHTDPIYWTAYNQGDSHNPLIQSLTEDIVFPADYCQPSPEMKNYIWVGPKGTRSGLHFDPYNVLFVQVIGRKKILLLPPQDIPKCYLENDFFAQVDAENPDLARFPKFAECRPLEVEVGPGETLLIPVGWLHQVISLSVSFSVSITCLKLPSGESNHYEAPSLFRGVL